MSALWQLLPDSKAHGANMGPIWGRQAPGGPHVDPMNLAIWAVSQTFHPMVMQSEIAALIQAVGNLLTMYIIYCLLFISSHL